jgi:CRP-like cAMP-binding protein
MGVHLDANTLLASVPAEELSRLEPLFRIVPLTPGQRLSAGDEPLSHLYFPLEGSVSRLVQIPSGETVEVGIVGSEGCIGVPLALGGTSAIGVSRVQAGGMAATMTPSDFHEQVRSQRSPLFDTMLVYASVQLQIVAQLAACHCLHRIEQRLSRCLLTLADHGNDSTVSITHDALADFLGVHRPSITYALQALASDGTIAIERRRLMVCDRARLLQHACECYSLIRKLVDGELGRLTKTDSR